MRAHESEQNGNPACKGRAVACLQAPSEDDENFNIVCPMRVEAIHGSQNRESIPPLSASPCEDWPRAGTSDLLPTSPATCLV